ncbi:hypothetical protein EDC96DRAFT_550458, partial [Choanephora cucurbitarum]
LPILSKVIANDAIGNTRDPLAPLETLDLSYANFSPYTASFQSKTIQDHRKTIQDHRKAFQDYRKAFQDYRKAIQDYRDGVLCLLGLTSDRDRWCSRLPRLSSASDLRDTVCFWCSVLLVFRAFGVPCFWCSMLCVSVRWCYIPLGSLIN